MRVILIFSVLCIPFISLHSQSHTFLENGYEITSFEDFKKFKTPKIACIWKDKSGQLWIVNTDQIYRYDGHEFVYTEFGKEAEEVNLGRQISHIFQDSKGNIWLSRVGGGVGKYDPKDKMYQKFRVDAAKGGRITYDIAEDHFGNIWIGAEPGLIRIPNGQIEDYEVIMPPSVMAALKPTIMPLIQNGNQVASILKAPNDTLISQPFEITSARSLFILGEGQMRSKKGSIYINKWVDYGWITNSKGKVIWKMDLDQALKETSIVAALKDQIFLAEGSYELHYQTDKKYAYDAWDFFPDFSTTPAVQEWYGIQLLDIPEKTADQIDSIWNQHPKNKGFHTFRSYLYQEKDGTIWVGGNGLQKLIITGKDEFHFENYINADLSVKTNQIYIYALHTHDKDHLWVSFINSEGKTRLGLLHKGNKTLRKINLGPEVRGAIEVMKQDSEGNLWFGTPNTSLSRLSPPFLDAESSGSPNLIRFHGDNNQLNSVRNLEFDNNNNLWIGNFGDYFHKLNLTPPAIKVIQTDQFGIDSLSFIKVYKDRQKMLWLALEDPDNKTRQLIEYDPSSDNYRVLNDELKGIPTDTLEVIDEFSDGRILMYNNRSFIAYNPKNQEVELWETNMDEKNVWGRFLLNDSILVSPTGKLYHIFNNQEVGNLFHHLIDVFNAKYSGVIKFYVTPHDSNSFWASLVWGQTGRFRWTGKKLEPILIQNTFTRRFGIMVSSDKKFWFTNPYLSTDPHETGFNTNIIDPELVNYIYDGRLYEANDGKIWFLGKRGAVTYDRESGAIDPVPVLDPLLVGHIKWVFPHEDKTITITRAESPEDPKKTYIYHFHPDSLRRDTIPPNPVFSSMSIQSEDTTEFIDLSFLPPNESYTFPHNQNSLTIAYKGIHFNYPQGTRYQFRMEGSSNESWIDAGEKREASFFDLAPGEYTFSFKAMNSDGYWSDPLSMVIIIRQPWWWTWTARAIYLVLLMTGLYALYRFQLSRQLAQNEAQRLAELDQVKTQLYTNITHEFRTPLTVIQGMADKVEEKPNKWLGTGISMIKRNTRHLLRLVNQMLDLSKLESGKLSLHQLQADVVPYLYYLVESFESYATTKEVNLHILSEVESLVMDYDPDRLQDIVSNLLSNAIKFTPAGGNVYVNIRTDKTNLILTVKDTGAGIPAEKLPYIFDRFYQADDSSTRKEEGTGIGLALTRELIKLMEGNISVQSTPGKGSEFQVVLPIHQFALVTEHVFTEEQIARSYTSADRKEEAVLPQSQADEELPLVLVVEDNPDVSTYIASCLEANYRVQIAANGAIGIEKALEISPDLIITDVMMPEKDGFEVCDTLKHDIRTSHIPIVMLTAKADIESKLSGLRKGADAYLAKPFHEEELLVRMEQLLELRKRLQEKYGSGDFTSAPPSLEEQPTLEDQFITQVRDVVMQHLNNYELDVALLCKELGMSRTPLHNKLKALTGKSTTEFIRFIRLNQSKYMLLNTDLHISEVAYETGFQNPNYFSKRFGELFGMTPKAWREDNT